MEIQLAQYKSALRRFDILRSEEIANALYSTALTTGVEHMHGIMGLTHVSQVEYFLNRYNTLRTRRPNKLS